MNRPTWDDYYMIQAFWVSRRSPDQSTKHGCVLVGPNHEPISTGYNGYPKGARDADMPTTRPDKYYVTLHSEENAILFAKSSLVGATAYITGEPCPNCWARLLQVGVKRFVLGPKGSHMIDDNLKRLSELLQAGRDIEVVRWEPNPQIVRGLIQQLSDDILKEG